VRLVLHCQVTAVQRGDSTTAFAKEQLCGHVVSPATTEHAVVEGTLSVLSVTGLYNGDRPSLRDSPETAVSRVGGWCDMAASLRGHEPGNTGTSIVGRCLQAEQ
jgi:hypothetical protein